MTAGETRPGGPERAAGRAEPGAARRRVYRLRRFAGALSEARVAEAVAELPGVEQAHADGRGVLTVSGDVPEATIHRALTSVGFAVDDADSRANPRLGRLLRRAVLAASASLLVGTAGLLPGADSRIASGFAVLVTTVVLVVSGAELWQRGWRRLRQRRAAFEHLMAMATLAAVGDALLRLVYPLWLPSAAGYGLLPVPLLVVALGLLGRALQRRTAGQYAQVLEALKALAPERVMRIDPASGPAIVRAGDVRSGDRLRVAAGERVPADGRVTDGHALVDESVFTGDQASVERTIGDLVVAGALNRGGPFLMEAVRTGRTTRLARLIDTVREAQGHKPAIERVVDRVSGALLLVTLGLAAAGAALAWFLGLDSASVLVAALSITVLGCPPALGLALPLAVRQGADRAGELGAALRHSEGLQGMPGLTTLLLDGGGAIQRGHPQVVAVEPVDDWPIRELFALAASLDAGVGGGGRYPALEQAAADREIPLDGVSEPTSLPGGGISGRLGSREVLLGGESCLREVGVSNPLAERGRELQGEGSMPLFLVVEGAVVGLIALADAPRADAVDAVERLQAMGIEVILLGGQEEPVARADAGALGIPAVCRADTPEDALECVTERQARGERVAVVGQGTNVAAALSQCDIGFALAAAPEAVVRSADVALVRDSLAGVPQTLALGRATVSVIRQNIGVALGFNAVLVPVAVGLFRSTLGWQLTAGLVGVVTLLAGLTVLVNASRLRYLEIPGADD